MGVAEDKRDAEGWRNRARIAYRAATLLSVAQNWHGTVNRAYYYAYQACVAVCILHGDRDRFPAERGNPTHEQLPDLIANNGDLNVTQRRTIRTVLTQLRYRREEADYRVGRTIDADVAADCLLKLNRLFRALTFEKDEES